MTFSDGSERRHEEQLLEQSREGRLQAMVESSLEAFVSMDAKGRVTAWNAQSERTFGWSRSEAIGQEVAELIIPPVHREAHRRGIARFLETGEGPVLNSRLELAAIRRDGKEFPIEFTISALRHGDGWSFHAFLHDISDRKQSEQQQEILTSLAGLIGAARSLEDALPALLPALGGGMGWAAGSLWLLDEDGTALRCQETWSAPGVNALDFTTASHDAVFARGEGLPGQVWETGEPVWVEDLANDPDFVRRRAAASDDLRAGVCLPLIADAGFLGALEFFGRNTEAPDEQVIGFLVAAGGQVGQFLERHRERRRAEATLIEAKQQAERANEAKSRFLSGMSHELRTPLNAILGFGQLLEMDDISVTQREHVDRILTAGRHLLTLIDEVLDISRIETGDLTFSVEPVEIRSALSEPLALISPMAQERGIEVRADVESQGERFVLADPNRLRQVILNLLSNAVKYNRPGGRVDVCVRVPGDRLLIDVADTGHGIPADRFDELFVPFQRLGAEATAHEGTGLGLALSRNLVEQMGGRLTAQSSEGRGSVFTVELALTEDPVEPAVLEDARAHPWNGPTRAGGHTLLNIEDNPSNARLVEEVFSHQSEVTVVWAHRGATGLELAKDRQPDMILLDLHLPDMAGAAVLERLLADERTAHIPVVILSADATDAQIGRMLAAGASAYLTKPLDVKKLLRTVAETLSANDVG